MSREDFIAIASRLFSIFLFVTLARNIPSAILMLRDDSGDETGFILMVFGVLVTGLLLCAALWFFPLTIARKLLPVMRESRSEQAMDAPIALSVGLVLIGVWVMANALTDAVYWLILFWRTKQFDAAMYQWSPEQIAGVVATAAEIFIATWLIFGSPGIRRLIYKFRYGNQQ